MKTHRWSDNARIVLEERYLLRGERGHLSESPEGMLVRVARAVAEPERPRARKLWEDRFYALMAAGDFLPNSPTLMNAGKADGQLSACYVLPVEDSLDSIFDALKSAAQIHQSGGGTGFSFSKLRQRGAEVGSSGGVAGGPMAFLRIFDQATDAIKQGGVRRGANMGVLRVDHPDILEFIQAKRDFKSITNFNLSVGVTGEFFSALRSDRTILLICPHTGKGLKEIRAREVFDQLVDAAWACGDPGLLFLDRMNEFNPTPSGGDFLATNPCGEQPLLGYESCNLGSIQVSNFLDSTGSGVDWTRLREAVSVAVRFLDNVIDANHYPLPECAAITRRNRKIGLGVMGFADLLLLLGIPYSDLRAVELGEKLMSWLDRTAKSESARLARERGEFPAFGLSVWKSLGYPPLRNATVSTVAPTGTISLLLGASSGIEPIFAANIQRNVLGGKKLSELHGAVARALANRGVRAAGAISDAEVARVLGSAWVPARALSAAGHIRMQAAFQRHSDSAVSKTVNLPESASREDVARAYWLAYELGCKGITVYRDKCRPEQVLEDAGVSAACDLCVD